MHEMCLINSLIHKMESLCREHGGKRILSAKIRLGAFSHISVEHFREHFKTGVAGTTLEPTRLDIVESQDTSDPAAHDILLESMELVKADDIFHT